MVSYQRRLEKVRGRSINISGKKCHDAHGKEGQCLFRWDCINNNGIPLSTCVDGTIFGSCCMFENSTPSTDSATKYIVSRVKGLRRTTQYLSPTSTSRPFIRPYTRPSIYSYNTVRPLIKPYTTPRVSIKPYTTTKVSIKPYTTPRISIKPYTTPRISIKPYTPSKPSTTTTIPPLVTWTGLVPPSVASMYQKPVPTSSKHPQDILESSKKPLKPAYLDTLGNEDFVETIEGVYKRNQSSPEILEQIFSLNVIPGAVGKPEGPEEHVVGADHDVGMEPSYAVLPEYLEAYDTATDLLSLESVQRTSTTEDLSVTWNVDFFQEESTTPLVDMNPKHECGIRSLKPNGRIVGGLNTYFGKWPWQALIKEATWLGLFTKNKCGGVLLNAHFILTAAHCQPGFLSTLVVVLGEHDLAGNMEALPPMERSVRRVVIHSGYNPRTFENDLALLHLAQPVHFQPHVVPICLPRAAEDFTGQLAYVSGWGKLAHGEFLVWSWHMFLTEVVHGERMLYQLGVPGGPVPSVLQEVRVPILSNSKCQQMFLAAGHIKAIRDTFMCAGYDSGGLDSCERVCVQGDSGGPLMVQREDDERWVLAGTVSHGIRCADPHLPGVYMRVSAYLPWLEHVLHS
ncbi:TMPRSS11D [Cordylochernes scorpioides]|uniref:TMPRSS11D n=1 Tax=Cordylochernes scorpioides TaxID=51811 RepID=A0ABY6LA40_9ARAC|nr:TMPRSS11D [Cordylochernes scorpioides]